MKPKRPETPEKLFTQVMDAAKPAILKLWEEGDTFFPARGVNCPSEIIHEANIGKSYYQCNPHFWQCYWQGGVRDLPELEIDLFGQTFHLVAKPAFDSRYYDLFKRQEPGLTLQYGYIVEMEVKELPGKSQTMILADSCRDTYLPQRIYGYGKVKNNTEEGFVWDNLDRHLFIDKFYVTNRQLNEWLTLIGSPEKKIQDPAKWPHPALLPLAEQKAYCSYYGKRLLEAKLFDAATMSPSELKNPLPEKVYRPATPWQRDLSKTFLGMSRINPDYQLTPLDCQLAQVQGCHEKYFTTDSATWMGFHFSLGFFPESLQNFIEPEKNLKKSSRFLNAASPWHELGVLSGWNGKQSAKEPVAFRCYEEVEK
ncbi:MAG: hypothetical protein ACLGHN_16035 [Bacteriovoracia bacterium]